MLQPLMVEPLLLHPVTIIVFAVTGRAQAKENGVRIADIMVSVGCMEIDRVAFPCAFGFPLSPAFDMAKLTFPASSFLTLPCKKLPIFWVAFPPSAFHIGTPFGGEYCSRNF